MKSERQARADLAQIGQQLRPDEVESILPALHANAPLADFLTFGMLNQPSVRASYFDWAASVERITQERSLPDPLFTFQTDIAEMVMTVMPGLMQELPGPGKLGLRAEVASEDSRSKYHALAGQVLQTAYDIKKAYYRLFYLEERIAINRETMRLLSDLEQTAQAQNQVGKVTLQDVLRAQIEQDQIATEIDNLEDSRLPLMAAFKGSLGITSQLPNPPQPSQFVSTPLDLASGELLAEVFALNPRLKAMEAEVRRAEASLKLAYKSRVPDFGVGLMADAKASPVMFRPLLAMTLPIWRDKIAAEIAAAQSAKQASEARLSAEQIQLTISLAEQTFAYREVTRDLRLLQDKLIPKSRQSLDIARAGYLAGEIDFFNLIDAEQTLLGFQLEEVEARTQREILLAELSLLILGQPPTTAPLLAPPSVATVDSP